MSNRKARSVGPKRKPKPSALGEAGRRGEQMQLNDEDACLVEVALGLLQAPGTPAAEPHRLAAASLRAGRRAARTVRRKKAA